MAQSKATVRVSVVLDRDTDRRASEAAEVDGRSKSNWIAALVANKLKRSKENVR